MILRSCFKIPAPAQLCWHLPWLVALLLLSLGVHAQTLSPLAEEPAWFRLDSFQHTITHDQFQRLLDEVYAPGDAWKTTIQLTTEAALIQTGAPKPYRLLFASNERTSKPIPRYWKPANRLNGLRIALDPGHLGGRWANMEERSFQIDGSAPVAEGDLTLTVAKLLARRLRALGAEVLFVRSKAEPLTNERPADLLDPARALLAKNRILNPPATYHGYADPMKATSIQWQSELLFYRVSEIHARARLVNTKLQPDLVLCLHFNAAPWGDPANPQLVDHSHFHLLVNGCYSAAELALDDIRFEMLRKLLNRTAPEEIALSSAIGQSLAAATGLPPYVYTGANARPIDAHHQVWTRNLLANRLYACPVLYLEPYVMNDRTDFARIQLGDYEGQRMVEGRLVPSIFREYADAVVAGLQAALPKE